MKTARRSVLFAGAVMLTLPAPFAIAAPYELDPHGMTVMPEVAPLYPDTHRMRLIAGAFFASQASAIGIRADQQAAWTDFTTAAIKMLPTDEDIERLRALQKGNPTSFDVAEKVAEGVIARSAAAQQLKAATEALLDILTPEQIDRAELPEGRFMMGSAWE